MNRLPHITKFVASLVLLFISISSFAQDVEYVGATTISALQLSSSPPSYYYTKSVTIVPGQTGSVTISSTNGDFFITPIATNPPPSPAQNYVRIEVPREEVTSEVAMTNMGPDEKAVSYSYSDGLGRATMSSAAEAGPLYEDVVQHYEYDPTTGRQLKSFLPYARPYTEGGAFIANADEELEDFYDGTFTIPNVPVDSKYYSESEYDARGRMEASIGVGQAWNSDINANDIKTSYEYVIHNPALTADPVHDRVLHWKIVSGAPQNDDFYGGNELSVTIVTDVESRKSRSVKDMRGLSITSQVYDPITTKWYGSYNVYDDFGRVRFIIPPIIASNLPSATPSNPNNLSSVQIEELLFQYEYDERGRLKREKAPGAGWKEFVYDQWDRLVMTRHAAQQLNGNDSWTFFKYDALNRQVYSGEVRTTKTRLTLQTEATASSSRFESVNTVGAYTTNSTFPDLTTTAYSTYEIRAISQFDNYNFLNDTNWDTNSINFAFQSPTGFTGAKTTAVTGLSTGSKVLVLGSSPEVWLNTVIYYDNELRAIQTVSENHLGGTDRLTNQLDWKGELSKMLLEHSDGNNDLKILSEYEYEHNGQLLRSWQTINEAGITAGPRVLVSEFKYNVLGQMIEKNLHSTNGISFLQSVDYDYNIKGWTSAINNADLSGGEGDLFGMEYNYTNSVTVNGSTVPGRYDGVVSSLKWNTTNNLPNNDFGKTISGFNYDERNRLQNTKYAMGDGSEASHYDMSTTYDDNGNIKNLTRKSGGVAIDNLGYTYYDNSNRLKNVSDSEAAGEGFKDIPSTVATEEYRYDSNGNMIEDYNKEIVDVDYNNMQYVTKIEFGDGTEVRYSYDAAGNRLTKAIVSGDNQEIARVDYVGLVEYLDDEVNQVFTDEGRAYRQNDAYHYEYFLTDHQGNNRVAFGNLPERNIYTATMETEKSSMEESEFSFPSNIRSTAHNHTPLQNESVALNGTQAGKQVGPAKVLTIADGDEVEIDVWAKYTYGSWNNSAIANITSIISSAFGGASTGTGAESASGSLSNALGNPVANELFNGNSSGEPEAYLQYLFFDANYAFDDTKSGFELVGGSSQGKFSKLSSGKIKFNEAGYLFVYVVNESNQNQNVYFDDFSITHSSGTESFKVSQVNEFYPFGLATDKSWRSEGYVDPGLLYQSAYASYDSLTGYYDFLARSYDPALGRFFAVDPANQFSSPYTGMGNMPHIGIDPDGRKTIFGNILRNGALKGAFDLADFIGTRRTYGKAASERYAGGVIKQDAIKAASAYLTAGFGGTIETLLTAKKITALDAALSQTFVHGTIQGASSKLSGGTFASGFASGAFGSAASSLLGELTTVTDENTNVTSYRKGGRLANLVGSSVIGGVGSSIAGGDFYAGFVQAGIVAGANHLSHPFESSSDVSGDNGDRKHPTEIRRPRGGGRGFVGGEKVVNGITYYEMSDSMGKHYWVDGDWNHLPSSNQQYYSRLGKRVLKGIEIGVENTLGLYGQLKGFNGFPVAIPTLSIEVFLWEYYNNNGTFTGSTKL